MRLTRISRRSWLETKGERYLGNTGFSGQSEGVTREQVYNMDKQDLYDITGTAGAG